MHVVMSSQPSSHIGLDQRLDQVGVDPLRQSLEQERQALEQERDNISVPAPIATSAPSYTFPLPCVERVVF